MWDWSCFSFNPSIHCPDKPYSQNLLPLHHDPIQTPTTPFSLLTMILTSWLSHRRFRRYLCLLLCSPFLIPLFCATCPIIFAVEICYRICRRRRLKSGEGFDGGSGCQQTEGGVVDGSQGSFLLQRYLEDQLLLVIDEASISREDDDDGIEKFGT